jgi:hypothetical protein
LGKAIFLFFIAVTTAMAVPAPGSYRWDGDGGDDDGRATKTFAVGDPKSGDTGAS